jgi:hypothetical protein
MSGYAAISGPHAILWVARAAGLFEKNGGFIKRLYPEGKSFWSRNEEPGHWPNSKH